MMTSQGPSLVSTEARPWTNRGRLGASLKVGTMTLMVGTWGMEPRIATEFYLSKGLCRDALLHRQARSNMVRDGIKLCAGVGKILGNAKISHLRNGEPAKYQTAKVCMSLAVYPLLL
jgi:hypothetical protein